jgi:hypothetical protein
MSEDHIDARTLSAANYATAKALLTGQSVKHLSGDSALTMTPAQYRGAKAALLKQSK